MKRMLSSVGIGAAQVDTVLEGSRFAPGDYMEARVIIAGGDVQQRVDAIYFSIHCSYLIKTDEGTVTKTTSLADLKLSDALDIAPGERCELPVSLRLPWDAPLTTGGVRVWLNTGLDIKMALDPGDEDTIEVVPDRLTGALFEALERLGFRLAEVDCEPAPPRFRGTKPFVQEFEFRPVSGPYQGRLDELELVLMPREGQMEVLLEVDRKARGIGSFFAEVLKLDESRTRLAFGEQDLPELAQRLRTTIDGFT